MRTRGKAILVSAMGHMRAAEKKLTADEGEGYRLGRRMLALIMDGWLRDPWRAAFVYEYGRHPEFVIPYWQRREQQHRWMDVPDYDPEEMQRAMDKASQMGREAPPSGPLRAMQPKEESAFEEPLRRLSRSAS